ncbi:hypothetical protein [Botrimarina mediterranea]|uniref:hypothetical protein n=1 Tax=Botrimarina mediterranea TaxID=2528022 RepID=UPI00118B8B44|nr:hypothetical protein K2D_16740 [Planctomycetes bacterium K2D]
MKTIRLMLCLLCFAGVAEAQLVLRQATTATVLAGPFLDSTDGVTAETSLTISQADVRLSINGGNMAQKNESSAATHDELGYYAVPLDATDTGTVGNGVMVIHESGALPVFLHYQVVEEAVFDALYAASAPGPLPANTTGTGLTAIPWNASWDAEVQSECQDAITASSLATASGLSTAQADLDILTGSDGVILATTQSNYTPATSTALATAQADLDTLTGSDGVILATTQSNYAPATSTALATAQADLDIITGTNGVTLATSQANYAPATAASLTSLINTVGVAGAGLSALPWNAAWDAEVQSEAADAITAAGVLRADTAYDITTTNGTLSTTYATP